MAQNNDTWRAIVNIALNRQMRRVSGWSTPRPGHCTPGKETRYPLYKSLDGPQERSGRMQKISPRSGFDPWTVQPVVNRYTDYSIPAHKFHLDGPQILGATVQNLVSMVSWHLVFCTPASEHACLPVQS
jgi:hypothetical protein